MQSISEILGRSLGFSRLDASRPRRFNRRGFALLRKGRKINN